MQQKIANWKAESLRNSISKESAPEDASIARYSDFEWDRSVVGDGFVVGPLKIGEIVRRLRRRAFGENQMTSIYCILLI